ncbi:MAG: class I tRNA ligase family protein, partial [Elusimicrobia bacterium]|nr:class I tRNA ligase family protein [Elusimicrobiota bacterium]
MKKFYITTPLYYVNAAPHIGHAYTTLAADILSRYKKSKGEPSHFLTGTDEHGANIEKVAREAKQTPKEWADSYAQKFKDMWASLNISYDDFIRTTEPRHESAVQEVFERLLKSGDIYKGKYEGWYCLPCENYIEESELKEGKCPVHGRAVEKLTEETYFFRLSKFEKPLLKHYKDNPVFLSPKHRAKEITNFVSSGLKDISVSRTKVSWGIPVKSDPSHTIYVWFDALLNYATAAGLYNPSADFNSLWPADVHLVGKEIYRFHAIIWPAML